MLRTRRRAVLSKRAVLATPVRAQHAGRDQRMLRRRRERGTQPSVSRGEERPEIVDRVRLGGALVGPVALDAREPKRDAARIAARGLDAVERDLDDEVGADEDGDAQPPCLAREQLLRLP